MIEGSGAGSATLIPSVVVCNSVVDRHCFDVDRDPNFRFDDNPDPHPDPTLSFFTRCTYFHCSASIHYYIFHVS